MEWWSGGVEPLVANYKETSLVLAGGTEPFGTLRFNSGEFCGSWPRLGLFSTGYCRRGVEPCPDLWFTGRGSVGDGVPVIIKNRNVAG
jgi:hypothetical protein